MVDAAKELEFLLDNVNCGIVVYEVDNNNLMQIAYMSEEFCNMSNGSREMIQELYTKDRLFGVCNDYKYMLSKFYENIIENKIDGRIVFKGKTVTNNEKWLSLKAKYISDNDKIRICSTYIDITEQMNIRDQLTHVIHNVPGAVCFFRWTGVNLIPIVVSEHYSEMLGTDAMKVLQNANGLNFIHVHPDDLQEFKETVLEGLNNTHQINYTYRSYNELKKCYLWLNIQGKSIPQPDDTQYVYVSFTDITQEMIIEDKLRESKKMLELATQNAGLWCWTYDFKDDYASFDDRTQRDFEFPEYKKHFLENQDKNCIILDEYKSDFKNMFSAIINGSVTEKMDCKIRFLDGSIHWARFLLSSIYDENGNAIKAVGVVKIIDDVCELKEKYEIERRRGIVTDENMLGHALFNLTQNTNLEYNYNNVLHEFDAELNFDELGLSVANDIEDEIKREEYIKLHKTETLLKMFEEGKDEVIFDYQRKMPNNDSIWVRSMFHMMREPDGSDILLFDYCYDINKQKILELMMDYAVNDDYDLLGMINYYDNTAAMLYGQDSYNITGLDFMKEDYTQSMLRFANNAVIEEERQAYIDKASIDNIKEILNEHGEYEFYIHVNLNGKIRAKKIRYVTDKNNSCACIFTQMDITLLEEQERKKQDELKNALYNAKSANRSKTIFLSQMSHEIRTPMNAIMGMTRLAYDSSDLMEKNDYLKKIDTSSHYLLGIINDILDMSRIESGKFHLHPDWIPCSSIMNACINMLEPEMEKKGIMFIHPTMNTIDNYEFFVDPLRCQQIYMNLLNNAMKFTAKGGTILLIIENVFKDEKYCTDKVTISDTGCGMSKAFLQRVFVPFEQEENPYSSSVQGTGLGLSLVKQIIDEMGGTINVKSELNKGTTFTFTMRYEYRVVKDKQENKTANDYSVMNGKRALLVDDHPLNQEIATKLLETQGMIVEQAVNGAHAVELFTASKEDYYDIVLMDIRMPVMNGIESSCIIRSMNRDDAKNVPIIAMTANAFDEDVRASMNAGMNAHIAKPIEPDKLFGVVSKWLAKVER